MGNELSVLSDIIIPILTIISALLDRFVDPTTGNALTATGDWFVGALATLVFNVTTFLAQLSTLLPSGNSVT